MVELVRHRQTKGGEQICPTYSHRATSRLYTNDAVGGRPHQQRYAHLSNDPVRAAAEAIGETITAAMNRAAPK
jgi:hypothetical protein